MAGGSALLRPGGGCNRIRDRLPQNNPIAELAWREVHVECDFVGKCAQQRLRQPGAAIGPAMRVFIFMKAVAQRGMSMARFDEQSGILQHEPLDRDAEPANVARLGLHLSGDRAARDKPYRGAARRDDETIETAGRPLRMDDFAVDDEVQIGIAVERVAKCRGAREQRGADRRQVLVVPFEPRQAELPSRP